MDKTTYVIVMFEERNGYGKHLNKVYKYKKNAIKKCRKLIGSGYYDHIMLRENEDWSCGQSSTPIRTFYRCA